MDKKELADILIAHKKWANDEPDGKRAYLQGADLRGADLRGAYLQGAYLRGAYLQRADLQGADLRGADLQGADLQDADLQGAYLQGADLRGADLQDADLRGAYLQRAYLQGADLRGADLQGADLQGADLQGADLRGAKIGQEMINKFFPITCPEYGAFIAWKKAGGMIVKLKIPEDAKRGSAFGRKCRASKAVCVAIENPDGTPSDITSVMSNYDNSFVYTVGETVEVKDFDDDRLHECAPGIHFFITRQEAVYY